MQLSSLDDFISHDNPIRFIDVFVDQLDLAKLKFEIKTNKVEGRPSFETGLILKINLSGYLNGVVVPELIERLKNWKFEFKESTYFCLK